MNEARVYADGFERSFAEVKDLLEFLAERGRNAKWIRKPTNNTFFNNFLQAFVSKHSVLPFNHIRVICKRLCCKNINT